VAEGKRFVYILKSITDPGRSYIGVTSDLHGRLGAHNAGECVHTARSRPWTLDVVIAFSDEPRALAFERYLKSGSGTAFSDRHLR
jgi:putative endonuclease